MRRFSLPIMLALATTLALAGCGNDSEKSATDTAPSTTAPGDTPADTSADDSTTATAATEFPCDVFSQEEIEQLAGNALDPGDMIRNNIDENGVQWAADACTWTNLDDDTATEVTLAVSRADDFPSGSVECPERLGAATISGAGDTAYWEFNDAVESAGIGELRVCSADALIGVQVDGPGDEASLQQKALDIANETLDRL